VCKRLRSRTPPCASRSANWRAVRRAEGAAALCRLLSGSSRPLTTATFVYLRPPSVRRRRLVVLRAAGACLLRAARALLTTLLRVGKMPNFTRARPPRSPSARARGGTGDDATLQAEVRDIQRLWKVGRR